MKLIKVPLLRSIREKKGWTQELLAEHAGMSKRTVQRLESGENTTVESAQSLAATLGLPSYESLCCYAGQDGVQPASPPRAQKVDDDFTSIFNRVVRGPAFWANLVAMSASFIFAPMWMLGAGGGESGLDFGDWILVLGVFYLATVGALSKKGVFVAQGCSALFFALLLWLNSAPTSGWGTLFYTDAQVERFVEDEKFLKLVREMQREYASLSEQYRSLSASSMIAPTTNDAKTWHVSVQGDVVTSIVDESVCRAVNAQLNPGRKDDAIPRCDTPEGDAATCCIGG